jgi:hypothetical protein
MIFVSYIHSTILDGLSHIVSYFIYLQYKHKGCFFKFGVEVGVGKSIEIAPLV